MITYELWHLTSGNRIVSTEDENELRDILQDVLALGDAPSDLNLGLPDGRVLEGGALVAWLGES